MQPEERLRIIAEASADEPGAERLADHLEERTQRAPWADPDWMLPRLAGRPEPHPDWALGSAQNLPALAALDEPARRSLMRDTRAARGLSHQWRKLRNEALLAGLGDGAGAVGRDRMFAGLWTTGRLQLASTLQWPGSSGCKTHAYLSRQMLEALAWGDDALVTAYLPAGAPLGAGAYRTQNIESNALSAVLHGEHVEEAAAGARKVSETRSAPQFEQLLARYLAAVVEREEAEARAHLDEILETWLKSPANRTRGGDPVLRIMPLALHGYVELGSRRFGWDPMEFASAPPLSEEWLRAAAEFRALSEEQRREALQPVVVFHGLCTGLNRIFREHPLAGG